MFEAVDSDLNLTKTLDSCCPVKAKLELKIGAQVPFFKNTYIIWPADTMRRAYLIVALTAEIVKTVTSPE